MFVPQFLFLTVADYNAYYHKCMYSALNNLLSWDNLLFFFVGVRDYIIMCMMSFAHGTNKIVIWPKHHTSLVWFTGFILGNVDF